MMIDLWSTTEKEASTISMIKIGVLYSCQSRMHSKLPIAALWGSGKESIWGWCYNRRTCREIQTHIINMNPNYYHSSGLMTIANKGWFTRYSTSVKFWLANKKSPSKDFCKQRFSQYYWQESFDGDSFVCQSEFDAYATVFWAILRPFAAT